MSAWRSEGRPQDLIRPTSVSAEGYYHRFTAHLADHGFIVYCPQNPYIGGENFQKLQRLANPLKLSLFSFILSQHERTLDWLTTHPNVEASRIGFSYGGKTAVRVPPLLTRYALSICSADFNEGVSLVDLTLSWNPTGVSSVGARAGFWCGCARTSATD